MEVKKKMRFKATDDYTEVYFINGLLYLQNKRASKLYSNGLETDEYIYFDSNKGFCFEDGCVIGKTLYEAVNKLISLKWPIGKTFYIKEQKPVNIKTLIKEIELKYNTSEKFMQIKEHMEMCCEEELSNEYVAMQLIDIGMTHYKFL